MENSKFDMTNDLKQWFKELLPKLSKEQLMEIRDNPEMVTNAVIEAYKRLCKEHGIDYTTTAMYQEELKYRQQKGEK